MMNRKVLFWPLAAMLLTACEKGLDEGIADVAPAGQVMNSVLQVRTRSGGSAGEEATVAYPVTVYVFSGEECRAVQTIGDEGHLADEWGYAPHHRQYSSRAHAIFFATKGDTLTQPRCTKAVQRF